jgi:glycosyltransferase involved in cell wall biosynthesis
MSLIEVTVLMTTYNHERYIAQAVESVLMQQTQFPFRLVILEDCSTDRTREILLDFQSRYPERIQLLLAETNQCSNRPFAKAFESAEGRYLAFLDGDDYWTSPHKLQKQVDFLDAHPECSFCFHNASRIHEDGSMPPSNRNSDDQSPFSSIEDLWDACFIAAPSPMYRKGLFDRLPNWYYDAISGDWSLYLIHAEYGKIGYINEVLAVYRVHSKGLWSGLSELQQQEQVISFYKQMDANFQYRYHSLIQTKIPRWRQPFAHATRRAARANISPACASHLVQSVSQLFPESSTVVVVSLSDAVLLKSKTSNCRAWPLVPTEANEQLFVQGPAGSEPAPWVGDDAFYEFKLYAGLDRSRLILSVPVLHHDSISACLALDPPPACKGAFLSASPNPVPAVNGQGTTTISWSTGDGSIAQVFLSKSSVPLPDTCDAAIDLLKTARLKGADFLFVSAAEQWWLHHYDRFAGYLKSNFHCLNDDDHFVAFDLRKSSVVPSGFAA